MIGLKIYSVLNNKLLEDVKMAKAKDFTVKVLNEEVMYTSISKSKDGYNSARIAAKKGDKEYLSITYEWEGDGVPSFALDLMDFMQANKIKAGKITEGMEEDYGSYVKTKNEA
jgi:hypothetical protein